jgi:FlaA1/EpsC-like NDP-sugar epimerase
VAVEPVRDRTTGTRGEAPQRPSGTDRQQLVMANLSSAYPSGDGSRPRVGDRLRRYRAIAMGLAITDAACIVAALMISYQVRYSTRPMPVRELAIVAIAPVLWVAVFRTFNLYMPQHLPPSDEFRGIIGASSLGIVLLVMASYWSKAAFPRAWLGLAWLLALLLELGTRRAWEAYRLRLRRDGRLSLRTLIVGTTGEAGRLAQALADPASGFTPIGYVGSPGPANGLSVVGDIGDLRQLVREHDADCFFVASTAVSAEDMLG